MKTPIHSLTLAIAFAFAIVGCATRNPHDTTSVQGHWQAVQAELGGHPMPEMVVKSISLNLAAGTWLVNVGDKPDKGTYEVDTSTLPHSMTVTGTDGPNKGKVFPSIYEVTGDALRICYDLSGAQRPAKFESEAGTKLFLVTYQRKQ